MRRPRKLRVLLSLILLVPSLLFLGYKMYSSWEQLEVEQWRLNLGYLGLAALALLLSFLVNASIWDRVVRSHGATSSFGQNLRIFALSGIVRRLPGAIWQVAGRVMLYHQEGVHSTVALQSSVWEVIVQLLSALAVFGAFLPSYGDAIPPSANYVWILLFVLLPFAFRPALVGKVVRLPFKRLGLQHAAEPALRGREVLVWLSLYFASWCNGGLILYLLLRALYKEVDLALLPALCGFVALSGAVGISVSAIPGGLGLREVSLSVLLSQYLPDPVAVSMAVLFRLWIWAGETAYALLVLALMRVCSLDDRAERERHGGVRPDPGCSGPGSPDSTNEVL